MISDARRSHRRTAIVAFGASAATGLHMPGTAAAAPDPCRIHGTAQRLVVSLDNAGDARAEQMRAELARLDEVAGADPPASCGSADAAQERPYFAAADWLWDPIPADPELDQQSAEMVSHLADGDHIANTGEFGVTLLGPDGIDDAAPGDTVLIAAGTYDGFTVTGDGTEDAPITIRAEPGAEVVVDGGGGDSQGQGLIGLDGRSHIRLIGISVRGSGSHGIYGAGVRDIVLEACEVAGSADGGIVLLDGSDVLIDGCDVPSNNARGTNTSNEAISIVGVDGFEVRGSRVYDNGEEGIDAEYEAANGLIHGNEVYGNRAPNIYIDSAHGIEVYDNEVRGATEQSTSGIGLAVEDYSETRRLYDVTIRDNVIRDNAGSGLDFWTESSGEMSGITVVVNAFSGNGRGAITVNGGSFSGTNVVRDNLFTDGDSVPDGFTTGDIASGGEPPRENGETQ